jgi:hypothetical protein
MRGDVDGYKSLVDQCLADYDTHGWVNDTWQNS